MGGTNGNLLELEEMSAVKTTSLVMCFDQMTVCVLMCCTSEDIKGIKFHRKLEST